MVLLQTIGLLICISSGLVLANNPSHVVKRVSWLKMTKSSDQNFSLTCQDSDYYPFNQTHLAKRVVWQILVQGLSLQVESGQKQLLGWEVASDGMALNVDPSQFSSSSNFAGIYKCALLAPLIDNTTYYAWHYLNWAVDYYADENLLVGSTMLQKYSRNVITLIIVWASFLSIVVLLKLMNMYSYESRHKQVWNQSSIITSLDSHIDSPNRRNGIRVIFSKI